jgi:hypothetical protein
MTEATDLLHKLATAASVMLDVDEGEVYQRSEYQQANAHRLSIATQDARRFLDLARSPRSPGLDVPRLTRAVTSLIEGPDWKGTSTIEEYAEEIATAYGEDER